MFLDWLISFCMAFSGQAVITFAAVKMLKARRAWIIWIVAAVTCAATAYANSFAAPGDLKALWSTVNLVLSIVVYVAFSGFKLSRALFIIAYIMLVTLLAEFGTVLLALNALRIDVTSGPVFAYQHPWGYFSVIVLHGLVLGLLLYGAHLLTSRTVASNRGQRLTRLLVFPVSQGALLLMSMIVVRSLVGLDERMIGYGAVLIVLVSCGYLLFYFAARKIRLQETAEAMIEAEQEHAAAVYEQTQGAIRESQRVAKLRHDFRNQVQVIELLCAQGETARASELLDDLLRKVKKERVR